MTIFPDNNLSSYFNKLGQPIEVNEKYEFGLAEIYFSNSYFNVLVLEDEISMHYYPILNSEKQRVKANHVF